MALDFTDVPGNLFNRIGSLGGSVADANLFQDALSTDVEGNMAQYDSIEGRPMSENLPAALVASQSAVQVISAAVQVTALNTLQAMILEDQPSQATNVGTQIAEVIRQMIVAGATVKACTIAVSASSRLVFGNGNIVLTTKRGDGLVQELTYPEVAVISCTADAQTGGATAGNEGFTYYGAAAISDVFAYGYPGGSGVTTPITAIDATQDNSGGNLLTNSDMQDFTANVPDNWTTLSGTPGTDFGKNVTTAYCYDGSASLKFIAAGTVCGIGQLFNNNAGTPGVVAPLTSFSVNLALISDGTPGAGVLTIDLYNTLTGAVVQNAQGVNQTYAITLTGVTTSWAWFSTTFQIPAVLPATYMIRLRITTDLTTANVYLGHLAMGAVTGMYPGGYGAAIFSGNVDFIQSDSWAVTATNNWGGSSNLKTFQALFNRFYGMSGLNSPVGFVLPSSGSPSISDSLISAT